MIFCELLTRRISSRLTEMIPIISQSVTFLQMFFFSETVVFLGFVNSFGKNDSVRFFKIFWGKRKSVISVRVPSASVLRLLCAFPSLFSKDLHLFSLVPWCIYRIFLFFNTKKISFSHSNFIFRIFVWRCYQKFQSIFTFSFIRSSFYAQVELRHKTYYSILRPIHHSSSPYFFKYIFF